MTVMPKRPLGFVLALIVGAVGVEGVLGHAHPVAQDVFGSAGVARQDRHPEGDRRLAFGVLLG